MKSIRQKRSVPLGIHQKYGVVISRLNRAGIELVPTGNTTLQFGDVLHMVGRSDVLNQAISVIGNAQQKIASSANVTCVYRHWFRSTRWFDSILYSRFPCCVKIRGLLAGHWWLR